MKSASQVSVALMTCAGFSLVSFAWGGCSGTEEESSPTPMGPTPTPTATPLPPTPTPDPGDDDIPTPSIPPNVLEEASWFPANVTSLTDFATANGSNDPRTAPVAVVTWDDVALFGNFSAATFRYQIDQLAFKITAGQMEEVVPIYAGAGYDEPANTTHLTAEFGSLSLQALQQDIVEDYAYLYARYEPTGGCSADCQDLETLKQTQQFKDFRAKFNFLYEGLTAHPDVGSGYTSVLLARLFAGFNEAQAREIATAAFSEQREAAIQTVTATSPAIGAAGQVSVTWVAGVRPYLEFVDLLDYLRREGFDVWIVSSALNISMLAVTGASSGYAVNSDRVIGIELEIEGRGNQTTLSILPKPGIPIPFGEGKVTAVESIIGKTPALIVGGTLEDSSILTAWDDETLRLVMHRNVGCPISSLYPLADDSGASSFGTLLMQGVDENAGVLRSDQASIFFGESTPSGLPSADPCLK